MPISQALLRAAGARSPALDGKLRSVNDYLRRIKGISQEVDDLSDVFKAHRRALGATIVFEDESEMDLKNSPRGRSPSAVKFFDSPDAKQLEDEYAVVDRLHTKLLELNMIEADLQVKFTVEEEISDAAKKAIRALTPIRQKIEHTLQDAYRFLTKVASKYVPRDFNDFVDKMGIAIASMIEYTEISDYLYAIPYTDTLAFLHYKKIDDVTDSEGKSFRSLIFVFSLVLSAKGQEMHVTMLNTMQPPGKFSLGKQVKDLKSGVQAIGALLDFENFANEFNRVPISKMIDPDMLKPSFFSVEGQIDKIRADVNSLIFDFKASVNSADKASTVASQLNVELQAFTRRANSRMRMTTARGAKGRFSATFFFMRNDDQSVLPEDLGFLSKRFNIGPSSIKRICDIINNE